MCTTALWDCHLIVVCSLVGHGYVNVEPLQLSVDDSCLSGVISLLYVVWKPVAYCSDVQAWWAYDWWLFPCLLFMLTLVNTNLSALLIATDVGGPTPYWPGSARLEAGDSRTIGLKWSFNRRCCPFGVLPVGQFKRTYNPSFADELKRRNKNHITFCSTVWRNPLHLITITCF